MSRTARITWHFGNARATALAVGTEERLSRIAKLLFLCSLAAAKVGFPVKVKNAGRKLILDAAQSATFSMPYNEYFLTGKVDSTTGEKSDAEPAPIFVSAAQGGPPDAEWSPVRVHLGNHGWVLDLPSVGLDASSAETAAPLIALLGNWALSSQGVLLVDPTAWQPAMNPAVPDHRESHIRQITESVPRWHGRLASREKGKKNNADK